MGILFLMPKARLKIDKQTLNLESATLKLSLHDSTLAIASSYEYFNEIQSTEIATANGYTQGGLQILNTAFSLYGDQVKFDANDPAGWTVTGTGFTFQKWVIRAATDAAGTSPVIAIYAHNASADGSGDITYNNDVVTWLERALARTVEFNSAGIWTEPFYSSAANIRTNIALANVTYSSPTGSGVTMTATAGTASVIAALAEAGESIAFQFAKMTGQGIPQHADIIARGVTATQFEAGKALTASSAAGATAYFYVQTVSSKYGANPSWVEIAVPIPVNQAPTFIANVNLSANPQTRSGSITNAGWFIDYDYSDAEGDVVVAKLLVKTTNTYTENDWDTSAVTITPPISGSVIASDNYFGYEVTGKTINTTYYYWVRLEDASNTGANGTTSAVKTVTTLVTSAPTWGGSGNAIGLSATTYGGFTIAMNAAATDPEGGLVLYEPNYKKSTDGTWTPHRTYHELLRAAISEANASNAATAATLANALKQSYEAHRISTREHPSADNTNAVAAGNASSGDTNSITALANELKLDYNAHRTQASVHLTNDTTNAITSADATDLATAYTLLNEIKAEYNLHMGFSHTVSGLSLVYGTQQVKLVAKDPDGGVASSETDTFEVYNLTCSSAAPTSVVAETTAAGNNGSLTAVGTAGTNSRTATKLKVSVTNSAATAATDASAQINEYTSLSIATGAAISQAVTGLNLPAGSYKVWLTLGSAEDGYQSWSAATAFTVYPIILSIDVTSPTATGYTIECDSNVEAAEYTQLEIFISTTSYTLGTVPADTNDAAITSARGAAGVDYKEIVAAGATLNNIIGTGGAIAEAAIVDGTYYSYIRGVSNSVTGLWAKSASFSVGLARETLGKLFYDDLADGTLDPWSVGVVNANRLELTASQNSAVSFAEDARPLYVNYQFQQAVADAGVRTYINATGGTSNPHCYYMDRINGYTLKLEKYVNGTETVLAQGAANVAGDTSVHTVQLKVSGTENGSKYTGYVDGAQQAEVASDTSHSSFTGISLFAQTNTAYFDNVAVSKNYTVVVNNLPTGYKARLLDSADAVVVGPVVEASGVATLDCSGKNFPIAKVQVLNGSDVVQSTKNYSADMPTAIFGGDIFTYYGK